MNSEPTLKTNLSAYIQDCLAAEESLQNAISDVEFMLSGGQVRYAIDFSEIHSYVYPHPELSKYFNVFAQEMSDVENSALERSVLKFLFYEATKLPDASRTKLVLLPPYALELDSFMKRIANGSLDNLLRHTLKAFEEEAKILNDEEFKPVLRLAKKDNSQLSEADKTLIEQLMKSKAQSIAYLISPPSSQPLQRIRHLLQDDIFEDLYEFADFEFDSHDPAIEWWYQQIIAMRGTKERPTSSAFIDATAIAMISQANQFLSISGIRDRCCIVTRGYHMLAISRKIAKTPIEANSNIIRHPRMFAMLAGVASMPLEQKRLKLKDKLDVVKFFLEGVKTANISENSAEIDRVFLNELLQEIRYDWASRDKIAVALQEFSTEGRDDEGLTDVSKRVRTFIHLIRNREDLRQLILDQFSELQQSFDQRLSHSQALLGFALQSMNQQDSIISSLEVDVIEDRDKYILRTNSPAMPTTLQFYSPSVRQLLTLIDKTNINQITWQTILEFFRNAFGSGSNYEQLLVMAYILGTLNKWDLAEIYCEHAIRTTNNNEIPRHEAEFFLAICMRKRERTIGRHKRAIRCIDRASKIKRSYLNDLTYDDPRFLKEKGTHILILHIYYDALQIPGVPSESEGIALLERAEGLCRDDNNLRLQIYNNLLDYEIDRGLKLGKLQSTERLQKYLSFLSDEYHNLSDWRERRPALVDTLTISRWLLYDMTDSEKDDLIHDLDKIISSSFLTDTEKRRVKWHRNIIETGKKITIAN